MKFVRRDLGEAAEVSSGGGSRGLLVELGKLAGLCVVLGLVIYGVVIGLAELAVSRIPIEQEARLFRDADFGFEAWEPEGELAAKAALCRTVLEKLARVGEAPPIPFRLVFLDEPEPNAFALPGGTVGVTRGLLESLDREIEFAFVLGHEMGHFANRDHLRGMARALGNGVALSVVFGNSAAGVLAQRADQALGLAYSRGQETAADDFGLRMVLAAYGDADGAERLFEVLEAREGSAPGWAYMFSTHPDSAKRIERLRARAEARVER